MSMTAVIIIGILVILALAALAVFIFYMTGYANAVFNYCFTRASDKLGRSKWGRGCSDPSNRMLYSMWEEGDKWIAENRNSCSEERVESAGTKLAARYYNFGFKNAVIINPCIHETSAYCAYYAGIFKKNGFNCLLLDPRSTGLSEGEYNTMGFEENADLLRWIHMLENNFGMENIIIMGFSSGAAAAILAAAGSNDFDASTKTTGSSVSAVSDAATVFTVADTSDAVAAADSGNSDMCTSDAADSISSDAYTSDAMGSADSHIKALILDGCYCDFSEYFKNYMIACEYKLHAYKSNLSKLSKKAGVDLSRINPVSSAPGVNMPVLFLHGAKDSIVSEADAKRLFDAVKSADKKLVIFENAEHGFLRFTDPAKYDQAIEQFLKEHFDCCMQPESHTDSKGEGKCEDKCESKSEGSDAASGISEGSDAASGISEGSDAASGISGHRFKYNSKKLKRLTK